MIINTNCIDLLKTLPDNSIDAIVTDPPYGLGKEPDALEMLRDWLTTRHHDVKGRGFMGKEWDAFVPQPAIWAECLRVLKPGGHLLAFAGTRTQDLMALGLRIGGFEIRDVIAWAYGSGFPKSMDVSKAIDAQDAAGDAKQWQGWGTALKPALEPITVARKPLVGTVAANIQQHGAGAINIDGCRVGDMLTPERTGRWPANLIHDGSDEVLAVFPDAKGQQGKSSDSQRTQANVYGATSDNGKIYTPRIETDKSAARFFYCAKASKADRNYGCESLPHVEAADMVDRDAGSAGMNNPRAGAGRTRGARNDHPTVKPIALMRYLCRLVTPPGGTVLDPFAGSGTTGVAAALEGFNFIGAEMDAHSAEIANTRYLFALTDAAGYIDGSDNSKGRAK